MKQLSFFDDEHEADQTAKRQSPPLSDPNVHPRDVARLTGQNLAILERLRRGVASNQTLAEISLKYTSRISDLRKAGYRIEMKRGLFGVNYYRLIEDDH